MPLRFVTVPQVTVRADGMTWPSCCIFLALSYSFSCLPVDSTSKSWNATPAKARTSSE
jgi:hypothetical protein